MLWSEIDWFLWQSEHLGIEVAPRDHRPLHPDAVIVHAAVTMEVRKLRRALRIAPFRRHSDVPALRAQLELARQRRDMIVGFAAEGARPVPIDKVQTAFPVEPVNRRHDDYGRGTFRGELVDYAILVDEVIEAEEERLVGRGKHRTKVATRGRVAVTYCPIDWRPSDAAITQAQLVADAWDAAMAGLRQQLAGIGLKAHVLV